MAQDRRAGEDRSARLILPQLQLDDLLSELQTRLEAARATRDRVHALLEAVVSIGGDLDLGTVLRRIVEAATTLVEARYGALGVIDDTGEHLVQFITVGVGEEEIEAIGHWPHGLGILGLLIKEPHPLRLAELSAHPASYGFPANHPAMSTFLGVPIRVRDEVFGNLYLTEKTGGEEFSEEDQVVVAALATAAGVAIENARLYEETRRREIWLQASAEISTALLSGVAPEQVVELVARRAREICDADLATVSLADTAAGEFVVTAADGQAAHAALGVRFPIDGSLSAVVYREGTSLLAADARRPPTVSALPETIAVGPMVIVSLGHGESSAGVLAVMNAPGRPVFTDATLRLLEPFAAQAAIAFELAERRRDAERLVVLEDRDRIAKDLHDTVIQRLFATAMTLMSAIKITQKPDVARRVQTAVDDLDDTIRQIRSTIFALQAEPGDLTLRSRIHTLVDKATESLGFAPSVRLDGLLDTVVGPELADQALAVLHEALSNIARHAHAHKADVAVDVRDELIIRVEDDGQGIPDSGRRSGLRNLADRAEALGGTFTTRDRDGGGTILVWRVPLEG